MDGRDESHPEPGAGDAVLAPGAVTALIARLARAPTREAPSRLAAGTRVGRYEIIRAIGQGGFGTVYEAHDTSLNRLVAFKALHRAETADPAAAREVEVASRLAHPNIAALYDAGVLDDGFAYLVYEILHGETLESRLARGPVPPAEAAAIAAQVARALAHAHAHGVVHRDLKPANVFLTAEGDVKVLDFGIALLFGRAAPAGGTPAYMAPEQRRGAPEDARTDLYALGLLLHEMLTGDRFVAVPSSGSGPTPAPIRRVLASLLADDPVARPRSARAAQAQLENVAGALAAPRMRRRVLVIAASVAAAGALAGTLVLGGRAHVAPPPARPASIAVLPFVDMSPQKDQEYFSDGVAEEILNALARVDGLRVVGRTSSFSFKGKGDDVRAIGRTLDVGALLEGSVRKSGDRVRVSAQLISTADGYRMWSDSYDRELSDVFAVQSDIARSVVSALQVELLHHARAMPSSYRTPNAEAYDSYLLGRQLLQRASHASLTQGVETLRRAVSLDPSYGPAWAALAHALLFRAWLDLDATGTWAAARREARAAAEEAVRLAPHLADGYVSRAAVRIYDWEWSGARADIDRALAIDPRNAELQTVIVRNALAHGRTEEAISAATSMTESDPLNPRAWNSLGVAQDAAGNIDLARRAYARTLGLNPEYLVATLNVIWTDVLSGRSEEALAGCDRVRARADAGSARVYARFCLAATAMAHHDLGHVRQSDVALERLLAEAPGTATFIADVYAWRGQSDQAFAWLERAVADHDQYGGSLETRPTLRKIRGDPRFATLLREMGLPAE